MDSSKLPEKIIITPNGEPPQNSEKTENEDSKNENGTDKKGCCTSDVNT